MESFLSGRKRKVNKIEDEHNVDRVFGIVTDAFEWSFMASFKLSKLVIVVCDDAVMKVKKVLLTFV